MIGLLGLYPSCFPLDKIIHCVFACSAGIRSDTHMLALAYGGELCYWYHLLSATTEQLKDSNATTQTDDVRNWKIIGFI